MAYERNIHDISKNIKFYHFDINLIYYKQILSMSFFIQYSIIQLFAIILKNYNFYNFFFKELKRIAAEVHMNNP